MLCCREELPTIYKCPHQGCTAVYRGADGMKKHIKEHHEEVRERPCPHPGCNKVFMVDRYLQRHVKLIHTGVCRPGQAGLRAASPLYSVARQLNWSECGVATDTSRCFSGSLSCWDFIIALCK